MTGGCLGDCLLAGIQFFHHLGPLPGWETSGILEAAEEPGAPPCD